MEMRFLGKTGLSASAFFGIMTFGGGKYFEHMGATQVDEARHNVIEASQTPKGFLEK